MKIPSGEITSYIASSIFCSYKTNNVKSASNEVDIQGHLYQIDSQFIFGYHLTINEQKRQAIT